jgi:hypothetical protein
MPILRWVRQTDSSIFSASSAAFRAIEVEQKGRFDAHYDLHEISCGRPDRNPATAEQD